MDMKRQFEERKAIRREKLEAEGKKPKEIEGILNEEFGTNSKAYKSLKRRMIRAVTQRTALGGITSGGTVALRESVLKKLPSESSEVVNAIGSIG